MFTLYALGMIGLAVFGFTLGFISLTPHRPK
jgi:hypothetical protein